MDKTKTISAIILVAGIGKRISNYTIKPKCLLKLKVKVYYLEILNF